MVTRLLSPELYFKYEIKFFNQALRHLGAEPVF
jgi:hypothetical protein